MNRNLALIFVLFLLSSCASRHVKSVVPVSPSTSVTQNCDCSTQKVPAIPSTIKPLGEAKPTLTSQIPDYALLRHCLLYTSPSPRD